MLKIRNQTTGESIALVRDVCHRHPEWVHEQCGTKSESELQGMWDCMQERDYYGKGEDECGIYWEGEPHLTEMKALRMCLGNDLIGLNFVEMDDYHGFFLKQGHTTLYTVYVAQDGSYSAYEAIQNLDKGIDIEDERPLIERSQLFATVSRIKTHHIQHAGAGLYPNPVPPNSITDYNTRAIP